MSLSKEEFVLAACLLETTDASLSAEDAMSDVKQIMMNLPESLDPAYEAFSQRPRVFCFRQTGFRRERQ